MYRPEKYQKDDREFIHSFIKHHPFATFITKGKQLAATHIPVLTEGEGENWILYSHIANHNEQLSEIKDGAEALIIFSGAQGYVSSSWYESEDISTWDYSAVHVNARIRVQTREELEISLKQLVATFEKKQKKPVFYEDLPKKMVQEHLPLITGFWLEPVKVRGIAKLHQKHDRKDTENTVKELANSEDPQDRLLSEKIKRENNIE